MVDQSLTTDTIMNTGEDVLRKFGPEKSNLSDVAKALKVSHAALYKYFKNKDALWNAIAERWLDRISEPLNTVMNTTYSSASEKMERWLRCLAESKKKSAMEDPEMFHLYTLMVEHSEEVLHHHLDYLIGHLTEICREGIDSGEFDRSDEKQKAKAIFSAFSSFHNPLFSEEWDRQDYLREFQTLWQLIRDGLVKNKKFQE